MNIIKTVEMATNKLTLVEVEPGTKYEIRFNNEVLGTEFDYDRACEEFKAWKDYYI